MYNEYTFANSKSNVKTNFYAIIIRSDEMFGITEKNLINASALWLKVSQMNMKGRWAIGEECVSFLCYYTRKLQ